MEPEMPASERPPRRYSDQEVERLLDRATELQRELWGAEGSLTLLELEEIALEAGIDPQLLRRAATELDSGGRGPPSRWSGVMGAAPTILFERTVPTELSAAGLESIVVEIQQAAGVLGQPSLVGNTLTWRSRTPNNTRSLQIVVASRKGETYIRVEEELNQLAGALFGGLMGGVGCGVGFGVGMGVGFGVLGSALFAFTFPAGAIAASYLAARTAFSTQAGARRRALEDLVERLADAVTDVAREPTPDGEEGAPRLPSL
jgi:hypothetical protein